MDTNFSLEAEIKKLHHAVLKVRRLKKSIARSEAGSKNMERKQADLLAAQARMDDLSRKMAAYVKEAGIDLYAPKQKMLLRYLQEAGAVEKKEKKKTPKKEIMDASSQISDDILAMEIMYHRFSHVNVKKGVGVLCRCYGMTSKEYVAYCKRGMELEAMRKKDSSKTGALA